MGKSVAKLRRQLLRAQARAGEGSAEAARAAAALEERTRTAEAAVVAEAALIKAQKKRRHEANKEKLKQRKKARAADTGERQPPTFTLLISNLKRDLDVETVVWEFFERHNVAVSKVKPIGHSGARAKVTVATDEDVMKACSLHRCMLAGRPINVERGGPDSGTDESAAALQRAQMEMAKSQLSEFGLLRLEEDDQLVRHLAYHNKDTVHKALAYYCQEAQEGARNEAAVISALLKKQAAMEEPKKPAAEGEQEALEEQFPWQGKR